MPSLASRIIDLHAQKKSRDEIIGITGCTTHYLRSVLSRAAAQDKATRARRMSGKAMVKGTTYWAAKGKGRNARNRVLRAGGSLDQARAAARATYRQIMCSASEPTGATP
jgi:hypothetical protein